MKWLMVISYDIIETAICDVILLPTSIVMYGHWSHKYIKYHILNKVVNGYDIEMVCDCRHNKCNSNKYVTTLLYHNTIIFYYNIHQPTRDF